MIQEGCHAEEVLRVGVGMERGQLTLALLISLCCTQPLQDIAQTYPDNQQKTPPQRLMLFDGLQ